MLGFTYSTPPFALSFWKHLENNARYLPRECQGRYLSYITSALRDVIGDPRQAELIVSLARDYANELLYSSYSRHNVYYQTRQFFFRGSRPRRITSLNQLDDFLGLFDFQPRRWDVVAKVTGTFWEYQDAIRTSDPTISITIAQTPPQPRGTASREQRYLRQNATYPLFVVFTGVPALDSFGARSKAVGELRRLEALCRVQHHKRDFGFAQEMMVYEQSTANSVELSEPVSPLLAVREMENSRGMSPWLKACLANTAAVPAQFLRAIQLHATALDAEAADTQFLTLWTSLEGILPRSDEEATIPTIVNLLEPVLCRRYVPKLLADLHHNLVQCAPDALAQTLSQVHFSWSDKDLHKLAAVVCLEQFDAERQQLLPAIGRNPLLRYRIDSLHEHLQAPPNIKSTIGKHWARVKWHLHRMYRTRNILVHTAEIVPYLNPLSENLHSYIDMLIDAIGEQFCVTHWGSIDLALRHINLEYSAYVDTLDAHKKDTVSIDNYKELLQLAPAAL